MSKRIDDLKRARVDADRGSQQNVLEWIADHSDDVQARDLANRVLDAPEEE